MSIRRTIAAVATLLGALAVAGATTGLVAMASPETHAATVQAAHASPNYRCSLACYRIPL